MAENALSERNTTMTHPYDIDVNDELIDADDLKVNYLDGVHFLNADVVNQNVNGTGNDVAINGDQINNLVDRDDVYDPNVDFYGMNGGHGSYDPGGSFVHDARANAGAATSATNASSVGQDGSISGAGNATSSGAATARLGNQSVSMDENVQANQAEILIHGGNSTGTGGEDHTPASYAKAIELSDELIDVRNAHFDDIDGVQLLNADVVNQKVSGPGNDTAINLDQINNLHSDDTVDHADVHFSGAKGGGYDSHGGSVDLDARATSQHAQANNNEATVGEDGEISNAGNATSAAAAAAAAFNQSISTGGNVQFNSVRMDLHGGTSEGVQGPSGDYRDKVDVDEEIINADDMKVGELNGVQAINGDLVNQNATGSGNDVAANLDQMNNAVDNDKIKDPNVKYSGGSGGYGGDGGGFTLYASATAATASALTNTSEVTLDGSISGAGNATSSAEASAAAFNQSLDTGANVQANQAEALIDGGSAVSGGPAPCDDDCGEDVCDDQDPHFSKPAIEVDNELIDLDDCAELCDLEGIQFLNADVVNQDVSGAGNDVAFNLDQVNNLVDNDSIQHPDVDFCGLSGDCDGDGGDFTLTAVGTSGTAYAANNAATIGEDGSISDAGNAVSSATASADAFNQSITMGANVQFNSASVDIYGDDAVI